ncbi:MAG TPA: prepilin-type N-terminal cleavage/methylation domain-containing protein [Candidatus Saccharimonadales bacterium]|nr:prepilin-type N-terminal cleavage/methylation domain-containing protein [Candidatus Saccharimonadales bacterium]
MITHNKYQKRLAISQKLLGQTGDTLVEVLISLAIISTVLGGAFVVTRNSKLGVRNSQEHTIAIKLIENQIEQMRSDASNGGALFTVGATFCMYNELPALPGSGNCNVDSSGTPVPASTQPSYALRVTDCNTAGCPDYIAGSHLFSVTVKWAQINGGTAQETMAYRLYE